MPATEVRVVSAVEISIVSAASADASSGVLQLSPSESDGCWTIGTRKILTLAASVRHACRFVFEDEHDFEAGDVGADVVGIPALGPVCIVPIQASHSVIMPVLLYTVSIALAGDGIFCLWSFFFLILIDDSAATCIAAGKYGIVRNSAYISQSFDWETNCSSRTGSSLSR